MPITNEALTSGDSMSAVFLYNFSKEKYDKCKQIKCPRCKGFGRNSDDEDESCYLCKGFGVTWQSIEDKAWFRPLYARMNDSIAW